MPPPLTVLAPVGGTVTVMADVPDPVFAEVMVGPGAAIAPGAAGPDAVVAPIAGTVAVLHPHAFVVQEPGDGRAVLVHLGIDTVHLEGEGFTLHCAQGDRVDVGQPVVTWSPGDVLRGGRSAICPVVALEASHEVVHVLVGPGEIVAAGDPLLTWD